MSSSDADSPNIHIYDARKDAGPVHTLDKMHTKPVHIMTYNPIYDCVISVDTGGMLEYWEPSGDYQKPTDVFNFKSKTDLYEFKKVSPTKNTPKILKLQAKSVPSTLTISRDGDKFATFSFPDRQIRIFAFRTGKCLRKYDESIPTITALQQSTAASPLKLDMMNFGARLAADRELEKQTSALSGTNVVFDESGNFVLYGTLGGIKVVNIVTNRMVRLYGKEESARFLCLALYQGAPRRKEVTNLAMAASENPLLHDAEAIDPILFATAFRKARFYMFTITSEEYFSEELEGVLTFRGSKGDRDVYNEKPLREVGATSETTKATQTGTSAVMHTTLGDIFLKLFPNAAPKAVENFATHAKNGYYDGTIFHRIIPK